MKIKRDLTDSIVKSLIKVAVLLNSLTFSVASLLDRDFYGIEAI
ncbi:hypothetical protein NACSLCCMFF_390031 [Tenacibaculum maritimum]|nr:hypothetical protein NACSLCCMFF_390031 [Tenacibaculum maritimum]